MPVNTKSKTPLLLAGLAAFAYYKYNKMSPEKKNELKSKGMDLLNKYAPQLKGLFSGGRTGKQELL